MKFVSPEEMREWEEGKDRLVLMENAGKAIAEELDSKGFSSMVFVCGSGNNGGDGFTAVRYLPGSKVYAPMDSKTPEAKTNREKLGPDRFVDSFHGYECIVDCLLGIGIKGELRDSVKALVEGINREKGAFVVSVDVPTGLGTSLEVEADLTICLGFAKQGMQGKNFVVRKI